MIKLVTLGKYSINPKYVTHVEPGAQAVRIFVLGSPNPITVQVPMVDVLSALQGEKGIG